MKKQIIIGSMVAIAAISKAQNTFPSSGNTGMGTSSPAYLLDIKATSSSNNGIRVLQTGTGASALYLHNSTLNGKNWSVYSLGDGDGPGSGNFLIQEQSGSNYYNRFFINGTNGYVGVGNITPMTQFDVNGSIRTSANIEIGTANTNLNALIPLNITQGTSQNDGIRFIAQSGGRAAFEIVQSSLQTNSRFKIFADGSTYIGNYANLAYVPSAPLLTVGGDVRFAAYGGGNAQGNGIEILGSNKVPFRRGISTTDDANGAFNFFINSNQTGAAFNFKEGSANTNLMTLTSGGRLTVNGDAVFANYGTGPANANALEILGNGQIPNKRGISLDQDPNGHFDFFISNSQSANGIPEFRFKDGFSNNNLMKVDGKGKVTINNFYANATDDAFVVNDGISNTTNFAVKKDGSTSIGGAYFNSAYKLTVNGSAIFADVWVKARNTWPDYVFNKDYELITLENLKDFTLKEKHLPGVPSEGDLKNTGLNIADMQKIQMEKIEELYLYIIQLNDKIEVLKKENKELKNK